MALGNPEAAEMLRQVALSLIEGSQLEGTGAPA